MQYFWHRKSQVLKWQEQVHVHGWARYPGSKEILS